MTPHRLSRFPGLALAGVLVFAGVVEASAQFLPMPGQSAPTGQFPAPGQSTAFPPAPGQSSPFPPPGQSTPYPSGPGHGAAPPARPPGGADQSICMQFPTLREEVEKGGAAIKAASERKAPREEACPLFKSFVLKEAKMLKFLETNRTVCGVPPNIITQIKTNHAGSIRIRNQLCSAAPAAAQGPSLSDALGGPIIADDTTAKKGHGIFDTLTGSPLAR
jgi:hypothetical protein